MPLPLRWLRNPRRASDEALIDGILQVLTQLKNERWLMDDDALAWLEGVLGAYAREVDARISQGRLFD